MWECSACGNINEDVQENCYNCGANIKAKEKAIKANKIIQTAPKPVVDNQLNKIQGTVIEGKVDILRDNVKEIKGDCLRESSKSIDLQKESPSLLEAVRGPLRSKWIGRIVRNISISVGASIALVVGFDFLAKGLRSQDVQGTTKDFGNFIVIKALEGPRTFLNLAVVGVFTLSLLYFVYSFFANIIKFFSGYPKAGRTPLKTIEKYFMNLVPTNLLWHNWIEAYVCLLDQCKETFGGYDSFVTFWKEAEKDLSNRIRDHFKPRAVSDTEWSLADCVVQTRPDGVKDYQVNLKVNCKEGINNPPVSSAKDIGTVIVTAIVPLVQVGDRWYIAQKEWIPQLRTDEKKEM